MGFQAAGLRRDHPRILFFSLCFGLAGVLLTVLVGFVLVRL